MEEPQKELPVKNESVSEKVETSENASTINKQEVPSVKGEENVKSPVEEEKQEEKKQITKEETPTKSVLDELLDNIDTEPQKEQITTTPDISSTKTNVVERQGLGFDRNEIDIARIAYPKVDPTSDQFDPKFEQAVMERYIFRWAQGKGLTGPTLKESAAEITKELSISEDKTENQVETEKDLATSEAKPLSNLVADSQISKDEEERLREDLKRGDRGTLAKLLALRREQALKKE